MADGFTLYGFRYSVYTRIVRMALIEMGLVADYIEVDPFCNPPDALLAEVTALDHVPVLDHQGFTLTETSAILRYLDRITDRPSLVPTAPKAAARMDQVMGLVDAYVYRSCVRKVFSHGFYRPHIGMAADANLIAEGLAQAQPALHTLDLIAQEGAQLSGANASLADIHLAPMIAYFALTPQGASALQGFAALYGWWMRIRERASLIATDPFASTLALGDADR